MGFYWWKIKSSLHWSISFPPKTKSRMNQDKLKKIILKQANFSNVNLSPDGLEFFLDYLTQTEQNDVDLIYEIIQTTIEKTNKKEKILTEEHLKKVIELNASKKNQKDKSPIKVISFLGDESSK